MENNIKNTGNSTLGKKILIIAVYYVCLFGLWLLSEFVLCPFLADHIESTWGIAIVRDVIVKSLIWLVPALILIKKNERDCTVGYSEMFRAKVPVREVILMFALIIVFVVGGTHFREHTLTVSDEFGLDKIIIFLFVGLTEESVFRGWLLNYSVRNEEKPYVAVAVNTLMFLCIHFPIWITEGTFVMSFTSGGFISIMILSVLFSMVFLKSRNLLLTAALHSFYDLLVFLFVA